ncbi:MAG: hypothetical protein PHW59_11200, partial [Desulfobacterales bacterium]|nr:hypothetical protein [Desulfobacterales bacterium]
GGDCSGRYGIRLPRKVRGGEVDHERCCRGCERYCKNAEAEDKMGNSAVKRGVSHIPFSSGGIIYLRI